MVLPLKQRSLPLYTPHPPFPLTTTSLPLLHSYLSYLCESKYVCFKISPFPRTAQDAFGQDRLKDGVAYKTSRSRSSLPHPLWPPRRVLIHLSSALTLVLTQGPGNPQVIAVFPGLCAVSGLRHSRSVRAPHSLVLSSPLMARTSKLSGSRIEPCMAP